MENLILIDWCSFTIRLYDEQNDFRYSLTDVVDLLGLSDYIERFEHLNGFYGYKDRFYFGGINLHCNNENSNTIWVEMSGSGCRTFETYGTNDFTYLFHFFYVNKHIVNINRIDIAYDDFNNVLEKDTIIHQITTGFYISRFKSIYSEISYTSDDWTLYFGSKKSDVMFRIYDKSAEREVKDKIPHWIRFEIQMRDDRASEFINKIIDNDLNIGLIFKGVCHNYVRFCKETKDSNKQRWKLAKWYEDFLDNADKIKIWTKCDIDYNFQRLQNFVQVNCGNAIDAYIKIKGLDGLDKAIKARPTLPNPKYIRLVNEMLGSDDTNA